MQISNGNPRKTRSLRELGAIDIAALREQVLALPESVWDEQNADKPNRFETLANTRHIVFRFVDSTQDWRRSHDRPLWPEWRERLQPVLDAAIRDYGYSNVAFPRVMLARMAPGGVIQPHVDAGPAARWPNKVHVVLTSNPQVEFWIDGHCYHLDEGHAYEVNNLAVHAVRNGGDSDRIHLIFEVYDLDQPEQ